MTYLRTEVEPKNAEKLTALITYLEKHQPEIIDYERRQRAGKIIGSGRMEKGVDQVANRQNIVYRITARMPFALEAVRTARTSFTCLTLVPPPLVSRMAV